MLEKVNWTLPGMERFGKDDIAWLTRLIEADQLVDEMSSLGWSFWPTKNVGYFEERSLRKLADFIEIQNKPFWDEYDRHCKEEEQNYKTPFEWLETDKYKGYTILDPDGWRGKDDPSFAERITLEDFETRLSQSTVEIKR